MAVAWMTAVWMVFADVVLTARAVLTAARVAWSLRLTEIFGAARVLAATNSARALTDFATPVVVTGCVTCPERSGSRRIGLARRSYSQPPDTIADAWEPPGLTPRRLSIWDGCGGPGLSSSAAGRCEKTIPPIAGLGAVALLDDLRFCAHRSRSAIQKAEGA